jgi:hypothetical protein
MGATQGHLDKDGVIGIQVPTRLNVHIREPGDQPGPELTNRLGAVHLSRVAEGGDVIAGLVEAGHHAVGVVAVLRIDARMLRRSYSSGGLIYHRYRGGQAVDEPQNDGSQCRLSSEEFRYGCEVGHSRCESPDSVCEPTWVIACPLLHVGQ